MKEHSLKTVVKKNRSKQIAGLYSVCSANELVLRAAIKHAVKYNYPLVIESTANQVNQFGGYTGIKPHEYFTQVKNIASEEGLALENMILGGDHLGPLLWQNENEESAMQKAKDMVEAYTLAGFTKIHLDTSMRLADDPKGPLDLSVCARRGAILAKAVFQSFDTMSKSSMRPVLVIGSEVPIPGGSQEQEECVVPTSADDFLEQVEIFKHEFQKAEVDFNDVAAFVVQPGVEFGDDFVFLYDAKKAAELCKALMKVDNIVFEGHSTDYQNPENLAQMVKDGVAILKVGPALTFVLREALFLLEAIEEILIPSNSASRSNLKKTLLDEMDSSKKYWEKYYSGTIEEIEYKKFYSYSDRLRYYLPEQKVQQAIQRLLNNVKEVPPALLSQFFPLQYRRYMQGNLKNDPLSIIYDRIGDLLNDYASACGYM